MPQGRDAERSARFAWEDVGRIAPACPRLKHGPHAGGQTQIPFRMARLAFSHAQVSILRGSHWLKVNVGPFETQRLAYPHTSVEQEHGNIVQRLRSNGQVQ